MKPQHSTPNPQRLLVLMRHAKTESPYGFKRDFDRVLTKTGEADALKMGAWLKSQGWQIDQVLSSTAERTRQTTRIVSEALGLSSAQIEFKDELYHATPEIFYNVIASIHNEINTLLIVSHNDGITQFANQLSDARIDHMQPGSAFIVKCNCDRWEGFKNGEREFIVYKQP